MILACIELYLWHLCASHRFDSMQDTDHRRWVPDWARRGSSLVQADTIVSLTHFRSKRDYQTPKQTCPGAVMGNGHVEGDLSLGTKAAWNVELVLHEMWGCLPMVVKDTQFVLRNTPARVIWVVWCILMHSVFFPNFSIISIVSFYDARRDGFEGESKDGCDAFRTTKSLPQIKHEHVDYGTACIDAFTIMYTHLHVYAYIYIY